MICKSFFELYSTEYNINTKYLLHKLIDFIDSLLLFLLNILWQKSCVLLGIGNVWGGILWYVMGGSFILLEHRVSAIFESACCNS